MAWTRLIACFLLNFILKCNVLFFHVHFAQSASLSQTYFCWNSLSKFSYDELKDINLKYEQEEWFSYFSPKKSNSFTTLNRDGNLFENLALKVPQLNFTDSLLKAVREGAVVGYQRIVERRDGEILLAAAGASPLGLPNVKTGADLFSSDIDFVVARLPTPNLKQQTFKLAHAQLPYLRASAAVGILSEDTMRLVIVAGGWEADDASLKNVWLTDAVHVYGEVLDPSKGWGFYLMGVRQLLHPRAQVSTLCNTAACLFAGGIQTLPFPANPLASDIVFMTDVDIFEMGNRGWGRGSLSEGRTGIATSLITLPDEMGFMTEMGMFAAGMGKNGPSSVVDVYNFEEKRFMAPLRLPTVSGDSVRAIRMSDSTVLFVLPTDQGVVLADIFDGTSGCWFSTAVELGPGVFSEDQLVFTSSRDTLAVVGEYIIHQLGNNTNGKSCAAFGGFTLSFSPEQCVSYSGTPPGLYPQTAVPKSGLFSFKIPRLQSFDELFGGDRSNDPFTPEKITLYVALAGSALAVSYIVSSLIIIRYTEGVWRIPFPPRSPMCRRLTKCCCWEQPGPRYSSMTNYHRLACVHMFTTSEGYLKGGREIELTEAREAPATWQCSRKEGSCEAQGLLPDGITLPVSSLVTPQNEFCSTHPHRVHFPEDVEEEKEKMQCTCAFPGNFSLGSSFKNKE